MDRSNAKVLLTGVTGFIGGRLLPTLVERRVAVRCLVRSPEKLSPQLSDNRFVKMAVGDLLKPDTLYPAMEGIDVAYYLVHSMGGHSILDSRSFIERDFRAAENFMKAAEKTGLQRIIYLGGLGETGDDLSEHLASRQKVAQILQSGRVQTTALRAANIIGAGGAPFEMLRYLVERLPIMVCPKWIDTRSQPVAVQNVIEYLAGCLLEPATSGLTLDIGGPDILTYRELMLIYSRVRGLHRTILTVPILTPRLSSYWINLMTPVPAGVVMPLVEGLRNEVVCRENKIHELIPTRLIPMEEAVCTALTEIKRGPGGLPSRQACLIG
ncbi:MAG: NAD(P)H-binding protein [Desulfoferrobacter sp.]